MKKAISLILALMLVITPSMTSFAAGSGNGSLTSSGGSVNADVNGQYVAGSEGDVVYSVDISWTSLTFTYNAPDKVWDSENHKYNLTEGYWETSNAKIDVVNHSNTAIVATPTWKPLENCESATMTFSCGSSGLSLASANNGNGANGNATSGTITVTPGGTLPEGTNGKIGQITVAIAPSARSSSVNLSIDAACDYHPVLENSDDYVYVVKDLTVKFYDSNGEYLEEKKFEQNNANINTPENAYSFKVITTFVTDPYNEVPTELESKMTGIPASSSNVLINYTWVAADANDNTAIEGYLRTSDVTVTPAS